MEDTTSTTLNGEELPAEAIEAIEKARLAKETAKYNYTDPSNDEIQEILLRAETFDSFGYHTKVLFTKFYSDDPEKEALIDELRSLPDEAGVYITHSRSRLEERISNKH
jgi:DNA polymerase III delta subunit